MESVQTTFTCFSRFREAQTLLQDSFNTRTLRINPLPWVRCAISTSFTCNHIALQPYPQVIPVLAGQAPASPLLTGIVTIKLLPLTQFHAVFHLSITDV